MSRETEYRLFAACITGAVSVVLFGMVMVVTGSRPLPVSFLAAMASGAAFGYWRTGLIIRRLQSRARVISQHTPTRVQVPEELR